MKKIRHTRIVINSNEKIIISRVSNNNKDDALEKIAIECQHCGEKAFWVEIEKVEDTYFETRHETRDYSE